MSKLRVVFQDRYLAVLYKPPGMLVYPDSDSPQAPDCISDLLRRTQKKAFPVHRLDKETSGLLVVAWDSATASQLARWFRNQRVQKTYLALVDGLLNPPQGKFSFPLSKKKSKETESAFTEYRTLKKNEGLSLVECRPKTGRHHQIRRHFKMASCPILGDSVYGKKNSKLGLCLSAVEIEFAHPRTRKMLHFKCEPHPEMVRRIQAAFFRRAGSAGGLADV